MTLYVKRVKLKETSDGIEVISGIVSDDLEPPWVGILGQVRDLPRCWSQAGGMSMLEVAKS